MTGPIAADAERVAGLRACEHGLCASPGVRQVEVLRDGWRVPESRIYCEEHAREASSVVPAPRPPGELDQPAPRRPLHAECLAALKDGPLVVEAVARRLLRPASRPALVRALDELVGEGKAWTVTRAGRLHYGTGPRADAPAPAVEASRGRTKPGSVADRLLDELAARPWQKAIDLRRAIGGSPGGVSSGLSILLSKGRVIRDGARYALPGTPPPGAEVEPEPTPAPTPAPPPPRDMIDHFLSSVAAEDMDRLRVGIRDALGLEGAVPDDRLVHEVREQIAALRARVERMAKLEAFGDRVTRMAEDRTARREQDRAIAAESTIADLRANLERMGDELDAANAKYDDLHGRFVVQAGHARGLERLRDRLTEALDLRGASHDDIVTTATALRDELVELLDAAGIAPGPALDRVERALIDLRAYRERVFASPPLASRFARVVEVGGAAGRRCGVHLELDGRVLFVGLDQAHVKAVAPLLFEDVTLSISRGPFLRVPEPSPLDGDDDDIPL